MSLRAVLPLDDHNANNSVAALASSSAAIGNDTETYTKARQLFLRQFEQCKAIKTNIRKMETALTTLQSQYQDALLLLKSYDDSVKVIEARIAYHESLYMQSPPPAKLPTLNVSQSIDHAAKAPSSRTAVSGTVVVAAATSNNKAVKAQ
jgi:hypothetical protein